MKWKLAELNIAKMMYDYEGPEMRDFAEARERLEALRQNDSSSFSFAISAPHPPPVAQSQAGAGKPDIT
jgi:hypothetical protein